VNKRCATWSKWVGDRGDSSFPCLNQMTTTSTISLDFGVVQLQIRLEIEVSKAY
jgi:hypothetical protein